MLASRSLGSGNRRIIVTHVLPNVVAPLLASVTFAVNGAILLEAGLSFLGVGIPLPTPSWGNMLETAPQPGRASGRPLDMGAACSDDLLLTVLSINFIGDGLRDANRPLGISRADNF